MRVINEETEIISAKNVTEGFFVVGRSVCGSVYQLRETIINERHVWEWHEVLERFRESVTTDWTFAEQLALGVTKFELQVHAFETETEAIRWIAAQYED